MTPKRKFKDGILKAVTYIASSTTLILLVMIFGYIIVQGKGSLSLDMLRNDYWSQNYLVEWQNGQSSTFEKPEDLSDSA